MAVGAGDADLSLTAAAAYRGIAGHRTGQRAHVLGGTVLCGGQLTGKPQVLDHRTVQDAEQTPRHIRIVRVRRDMERQRHRMIRTVKAAGERLGVGHVHRDIRTETVCAV